MRTRKNHVISETNRYIGNRIRSIRLTKGVTLQNLAYELGVVPAQILKYEGGISSISAASMVIISKVLGKPASDFYPYHDYEVIDTIANDNRQRKCIEVSTNFMKIRNPSHQFAVNSLVRLLANK